MLVNRSAGVEEQSGHPAIVHQGFRAHIATIFVHDETFAVLVPQKPHPMVRVWSHMLP